MTYLPPSIVRFLETLGIADQPTNGDFTFAHSEPDF